MNRDLRGKVAVVTGGSTGIGAATASLLAERGAAVVIADVNEEAARATTESITAAGGTVAFTRTDVSQKTDAEAMVRFAVETFGGLHLAFNNAGIVQQHLPFHEIPERTLRTILEVNVLGVAFCLQAEAAYFLEHGGGAIVNTSSGGGIQGVAGGGSYVASKHAVVGITRTAALDYARQGIRVNAIAPGLIRTAMVAGMPQEQQDELAALMPFGRMGEPTEIAEVVAFLLSDDASFVSGAVWPIDGAATA